MLDRVQGPAPGLRAWVGKAAGQGGYPTLRVEVGTPEGPRRATLPPELEGRFLRRPAFLDGETLEVTEPGPRGGRWSLARRGARLVVEERPRAPSPLPPKPPPAPAPGAVLIRGVRIPAGTGAAARGRVDVVLAGGRVEAIGRRLSPPPGATVVEGDGGDLLPGLWDTHVHRVPGMGAGFLAAGVTTVVDLGNPEPFVAEEVPGPRVLEAGFPLEGAQPIWSQASAALRSRAEVLGHARRMRAAGAACLKAYGHFPRDLLPAARAAGLPRFLHLAGPPARGPGGGAGAAPPGIPAHAPAPRGGLEARARRWAEGGWPFVTTAAPLARAWTREDAGSLAGWWEGGGTAGFGARELDALDRQRARARAFLRAYLGAGGEAFVLGTDTGPGLPGAAPGASLIAEAEALEALGASVSSVLAGMTLRPARLMGDRRRGRVEVGAVADLVLYRGRVRRAADLRRVRQVWVGGRSVYPASAPGAAPGRARGSRRGWSMRR